ncbi:putative secreted protein (Por secretion system target) [Anseongella ginsenosidimutans]|uniref:Putative secreted protein (Por secretion system target) n=1 Tax=Anseongella ginsenosidimutans TaxID=496056 RepID=A0A4R3KR18_9SPHI|nr:S8 family serine peptidase [Anseongella ginsenosidimutans]QEC52251.1 S8 family serine peptidase [Anseongella ginsenosidimutans]TCS86803.1 putative secreted protein (Por secretion system target) [Anseongella ginsenosidimutans]
MKPYLFLILTLASIFPARGQESGVPLSNRAPLVRLAGKYKAVGDLRSDIALRLAREKNWPVFQQLPGGGVIRLERIDKLGLPVYTLTSNNIRSAATTGTDLLWPGGSSGLNLRGASPLLLSRLGIWDGGATLASHQEFGGRIVQKDRALPANQHATHVAGTLVAAGINRPARGMAFGASNLIAYDFLNDNAEMAREAPMLLVSNHSYGALAGWRFNEGQNRWEWYGESGTNEDYKFGYYDITAREWDEIAWNAPYYLIVKSAGNNRNVNGPAEGSAYYRYNKEGVMAPAPGDAPFPSANDGYDILPLYANAKNILLVGAVNPIPAGYSEASDVVMASFSGWGPTDDGRIKPDIMGNGVGVLSTSSASDDGYTILSGTSMSSPNVAGTLFLLQELYSNLHEGEFMRSATLRGLAIHTAGEAGASPGPDYRFGWGVLNAGKAAEVILNTSGSHRILEASLEQGTQDSYELLASGYAPLEVTICWTDPEADTISEEQALDNPSPRLVNDLDVRAGSPGNNERFYPWILNPSQPAAAAEKGDNVLDNVEKLVIPAPVHGRRYVVTISHKAALKRGPQPYSLIISGAGGTSYCSSGAQENTGLSISSIQAGTLNYTAGEECTTYTNLLGEYIQARPGAIVPFSIQTGSCGSSGSHTIKVFGDWNNDGDFTGEGELLAVSAVLTGNSTFEGNIHIPSSLSAGAFIRLRIVAVSTSSAAEVSPCGAYQKGETLDTSIEIIKPARDLSVEALISPSASGFCPGGRNLLSILLRNRGTEALEGFPLNAEIREGASVIASLQETFNGILQPGDTAVYTFPYFIAAAPATRYTFTVHAGPDDDQVIANNSLEAVRQSNTAADSPAGIRALICEDGQKAVLIDEEQETVYWYDQLQGGNLIGAGDTVTTAFTGSNTTFYGAINEFSGRLGPATKSDLPPVTQGDAYHQYTPSVMIETKVPLVIESARMYTGNPGKISFTVYDNGGTEIARSVQHVGASRSTAAPGPLPDDPLDTGRTYYLDLRIPRPGNYLITVDYEGTDASIFRSTSSPDYPYSIPGIMSITGTTASQEAENNYYYFYGMSVSALGCPGPRTAVQGTPLEAPGITQVGDTLFSSRGTELQWYLNGEPLEDETGARLQAKVSGTYQVTTSLGNCIVFSEPYSFTTLDDLISGLENHGLIIYPNPGTANRETPLTIEFYAREQDDAEVRVVDMQGKILYREKPRLQSGKNTIPLILEHLSPGIYALSLSINGESFAGKFIIHR